MAAAWLDERDDATLYLARGRLRPLWLGRPTTASTSHPRAERSRSSPPRCGPDSTSARCARDASCTSSPVASCASGVSGPTGAIARTSTSRPSGRRARPSRASSALRRSRQSAPRSEPSGRTSTPSARRRSRTRYWNAVHAPRGTSSIRYTCHSDRSVGSARRASAQSAIFGRRPRSCAERRTLLDRSLEALLALEHLEPGLAQRVSERAERVRVERGGRERAPARGEIARRRRATELRRRAPGAARAAPRASGTGAGRAPRRASPRSRSRSAR